MVSFFQVAHNLKRYDTTKEESVSNLHSWYSQVAAYSPEATTLLIGMRLFPFYGLLCSCLILGNKVDLPQEKYSNIDQLAQEFAHGIEMRKLTSRLSSFSSKSEYGLQHMKTSAKEAININESIYLLLKSIVRYLISSLVFIFTFTSTGMPLNTHLARVVNTDLLSFPHKLHWPEWALSLETEKYSHRSSQHLPTPSPIVTPNSSEINKTFFIWENSGSQRMILHHSSNCCSSLSSNDINISKHHQSNKDEECRNNQQNQQ